MKLKTITLVSTLAAIFVAQAGAAVSIDEAAQLGKTLTPVGAERAGNSAGTIPEYMGVAIAAPASFKPEGGTRPDPFAQEKPRLVITAGNMAEHADKLTEGTRELLKRYPSYRVDVYPTHRTVVLPDWLQANTLKNATGAHTVAGGVGMENALPGVPFPIPKTGHEAMWNHLVRYQGVGSHARYEAWIMDSAGVASLASAVEANYEWPIYAPSRRDTVMKGDDRYWHIKLQYTGPARRAGEAIMGLDMVDPANYPRRAWQYLPGQRRVKLAPDICCDTPNAGSAGLSTYDDAYGFNGTLELYDFRLVGKKEMYVPYNTYRLTYAPKAEDIVKPKHLNPDHVRWELHRVWVVEATLKPGKRHIYQKRVFYLDEDSWTVLASDQYDARGELYRSALLHLAFSYDAGAPNSDAQVFYDFIGGSYYFTGWYGKYFLNYIDAKPASFWTPDSLAGKGVR